MKIALKISYDGTDYAGWQVQKNAPTVQEKLNEAVFALTGERVSVTGSGRTDAGVHAAGQVAHFETESALPPEIYAPALNVFLPPDIRVLSSRAVTDTFHAVRSAKRKTYVYSFYRAETELPLKERYAVRIYGETDLENMRNCAAVFVGKHDFTCFLASGSDVKDAVRTIFSLEITERGDDLSLSVTGDGFLYNMVRILAGTLLEAAKGKRTPADCAALLAGKDRSPAGKTMPAKGLCLVSVEYGGHNI